MHSLSKKAVTLSLFLLATTLTGCASTQRVPVFSEPALTEPALSNDNISKTFQPDQINQVIINGNFHVVIDGHSLQNKLQVNTSYAEWPHIHVIKDQNRLYLTEESRMGVFPLVQESNMAPVTVVLNTAQDIQFIDDQGNGTLITRNIGDRNINVTLHGNVTAKMTGNLVLQKIVVGDNASLYAYWVNSSNLQLMTYNNAKISLAGIVTQLDVQAQDNSAIDGRYLRVQEAFVRTRGNANVGVTVKKALSTDSRGDSSVYYYRDPGFNATFLRQSGSSLRMQGISASF